MTKGRFSKVIVAFSVFLAMILLFNSFSIIRPNKVLAETTIKSITVYSWEDYIDFGYEDVSEASDVLLEKYPGEERAKLQSSIIDLFEEETGIKVNYYSFATNEEMYNELLKNPNSVDLICPSEYMIMKMKDEDLIKPYSMPQNYVEYGAEYIKNVFDDLGLSTPDGKTYAIGYMWGTMGLIYDATSGKFTDEDFASWSSLFDQRVKGRVTIKDSLRDSYILAIALAYKDELLDLKQQYKLEEISENEYNSKLFSIFNRTDNETIDKVRQQLVSLKGNLYGFEVDAGKNDLLTGKIDVNFAWSGDAVYSMREGDDLGKEIRYVVPEEGSNVWFDGWVMTKNANEDLAVKFLDYLSRPSTAIRNMEYIGYTSCIAGDEVFEYVQKNFDDGGEKEVDLSYFFGEGEEYKIYASDTEDGYYRHLVAQYADKETILRCAVMDNFSVKDLELINEMWNEVKLITLSKTMLIIVGVLIVLGIVAFVLFKFKDKIFKDKLDKTHKEKQSKYKVVSKKEIR